MRLYNKQLQVILQIYLSRDLSPFSEVYLYWKFTVCNWTICVTVCAFHGFVVLQKKAVRIITFSCYNAHTSPIFKHLYIMKFRDVIYYLHCVFMFKFYHNLLPSAFHYFFTPQYRHKYNTRLSSKAAFCIPTARTNYGKFNIRFKGAVIWNNIEASLKILRFHKFKQFP